METVAETPAATPDATPPRAPGVGSRLVTLLGELMIIAGVLLGLYVVWQLFYTDIGATAAQNEAVEQLDWAYAPDTAPVTAGDAADTVKTIPDELKLSPDTVPAMTEPAFGTTFATFYVPRWGTDYVKPISEGVDRHKILDRLGIGHYP